MKNSFLSNKIIFSTLLLVAISGAYVFTTIGNKIQASALTLANIEALTDDNEGAKDGDESNWEFPDGLSYTFTCGATIGTNQNGDPITCSFTVVDCKGGGNGCNTRPCNEHN